MSHPPVAKERSGFFARLRAAPRRLSTAAWAAIALAGFLIATVAVVWTLFLIDPNHVPWRHSLSPWRVLTVIVLVTVIPPLAYWCLRLWLEGESSRFPDIDYAWNAGLAALRRNGIDLDAAPIFLILGSSGDELERVIAQATGLGFRVRGEPEGPAPLHWYANLDGIYVFCSEVGWLSALTTLAEKHDRRVRAREPGRLAPPGAPVLGAARTVAAPPHGGSRPVASAPAPVTPPSAAPPIGGTIVLDQFVSGSNAPVAEASARGHRPSTPPTSRLSGTISFDESATREPPDDMAPESEGAFPVSVDDELRDVEARAPSLDAERAIESLQRLDYLSQVLRRARHPLCPVNGVLMMLPISLIERAAADDLPKAVKSDLATLERGLQLRCPVTALVTGMEKESGFRELVRRVGRERAAAQRFGRRFDVRALATPEQMAALCVHVCGVFEDWIYTLFREEGSLAKPGNTRLYGLLCKVRCNLKGALMEVLAGGFGHDPQTASTEEPIAFSGCYFAATGATADRQAFVRGVFDKLLEEQEDVEWTRRALASAQAQRWFVRLTALATAALVVLLLVLIGSTLTTP